MAGEQLSINTWNPYPTDNNPTTADGSAGTWTTGTYSFLVAAWFDTAETDTDIGGWATSAQTNWNNVSVLNTETVHLDWTQADKVPDHYTVYYQAASSYNLANPGTKIAEYAGTASSADIAGPGAGGTTLIFTAPTATVINPVVDFSPMYRDRIKTGYDGTLIVASSSKSCDIEEVAIVGVVASLTEDEYRRLMKFVEKHIRAKITEEATTENDPFYDTYIGYFYAPDRIMSYSKSRNPEFTLHFKVESVTMDTTA